MSRPVRIHPLAVYRRTSALGLGLASILLLGAGCSSVEEDETEESEDQIQLEQAPITTALMELRAGAPYIPGIDESPTVTANPCLPNPKVAIRGGKVASSAALVASRRNLNVELGLEGGGSTPTGITGAASLSAKTAFDSRSASVLFQTTGTYESTVTSDGPKAFDIANVAQCGYGFVARAQHRVAAALVVSMRSTSSNTDIKAGANAKASVFELKASLGTIIQKGNVEISVRFASDVVPDVPPAPFADAALVVGESESDKDRALQKIDASLSWLAAAQTAVEKYILNLQNNAEAANNTPAPAEKVNFRYYPNTPPELRLAIEEAAKQAGATRRSQAETAALIQSWETFGRAAKEGRGHEWNIAAEPADSVEALRAKRAMLLEKDGGKLKNYESDLSKSFEKCSFALRNEPVKSAVGDLASSLSTGCTAPPAVPFDRDKHAVRPIAAFSTAEQPSGGKKCAEGFRLPTAKEATIFKAWSMDLANTKSQGLWTEDGASCTFSFGFPWMNAGKIECSGFGLKTGLAICIAKATGPLPEE